MTLNQLSVTDMVKLLEFTPVPKGLHEIIVNRIRDIQNSIVSEETCQWDPKHQVGTYSHCGGEMVYNVPSLGARGGFVHKETGSFVCKFIGAGIKI